jgi:hypothetical protein
MLQHSKSSLPAHVRAVAKLLVEARWHYAALAHALDEGAVGRAAEIEQRLQSGTSPPAQGKGLTQRQASDQTQHEQDTEVDKGDVG